jgi:hypothetical protein
MDFDSFSHGQIVSKLWLCEHIEAYIPSNSIVHILGGWHNVLGFMMHTRRPNHYKLIHNIDLDPEAIRIADMIGNAWNVNLPRIKNSIGDANKIQIGSDGVVINCSVEHFATDEWFADLPASTLVCIQSSNMTSPDDPWFIKQPCTDITALIERFPMNLLFAGTKRIQYDNWGYNRFMIIGRI